MNRDEKKVKDIEFDLGFTLIPRCEFHQNNNGPKGCKFVSQLDKYPFSFLLLP
jgi:hypothetical protein